MTGLRIRKVEPNDCESVAELFKGLDEYHRLHLPSFFRTPDRPFRTADSLRERLNDERTSLFLAEEGHIVGFSCVVLHDAPRSPIFVPQLRASISDIYVDTNYRRRGLARALLLEAEDWAMDRGAVGMDLTVYHFNAAAKRLFEDAGYSVLSSRMSKDLVGRVT